MKISDIYTAKGLKFKLTSYDDSAKFTVGALISIESTQKETEFLVKQYGAQNSSDEQKAVICKADKMASNYLKDLLEAEKNDSFRCIFSIDGLYDSSLVIQAYTFQSVGEYKTPIFIQVSKTLLERTTPEKLYQEYVWTELGEPALFCLNYKSKKKQAANLRFLSGKRFLMANNTARGIIAVSESCLINI